jgi:hypothetical protein
LRILDTAIHTRIFGRKRVKVTGGWRKLRKEELHNLYGVTNITVMVTSDDDENGGFQLLRKSATPCSQQTPEVLSGSRQIESTRFYQFYFSSILILSSFVGAGLPGYLFHPLRISD